MKGTWRTRSALSAVIVALVAGVAACGGSDDESTAASASASAEVTSVTVGFIPIAGYAPLVIAEQQGYFEEEGLEVKRENVESPAASVAAVVGGKQEFGLATAGTIAVGVEEGLPLKIAAPTYFSSDSQGIYVRADSDIKSPRDLEGKTVALGALKNSVHAAIMEEVARDGGDPSKVKFTLVPIPNTLAALKAKNVDVAQIQEPFITQAGDEIRPLLEDAFGTFGEHTIVAYEVTSAKFAQENPEAIQKFRRALAKASEFAAANPDEVRKVIGSFSEVDKNVLATMRLPAFGTDLMEDAFVAQAELTKKYGFMKEVPDPADVFID